MTHAQQSSHRSGRSGNAWEKAARAGFAVSGLVHVMLGYLIARIAFGSGAEASQGSALSGLSENPVGGVILWVAVAAWVALAAWQAADALRSHDEASDRLKAAGKAVLYLALAFTAGSIAMGGQSGGDSQAQGFAATLMGNPAGRLLVGAIGLGVIAAGAFHIYKGATQKFTEDLSGAPRSVKLLGTVGYPAKGVALGAIGVLFTYAAITADPEQAKGLDGAIESLLGAPAGPAIVVAIGVGFAAYGLYSFGRARYAKM